MSMMGSSKYEFEPEQFEKDYNNKIEVSTQFKDDLIKVIYSDYEYHDKTLMTEQWKRKILVDVLTQFIGINL